MSALYIMRFLGHTGTGFGSIYVGKGVIVGVDAMDARFNGTYTVQDGRLRANVVMSAPAGITLVTGQQISQPTQIPMTADWPADFAGQAQQIMVAGRSVSVIFEKIGDIP